MSVARYRRPPDATRSASASESSRASRAGVGAVPLADHQPVRACARLVARPRPEPAARDIRVTGKPVGDVYPVRASQALIAGARTSPWVEAGWRALRTGRPESASDGRHAGVLRSGRRVDNDDPRVPACNACGSGPCPKALKMPRRCSRPRVSTFGGRRAPSRPARPNEAGATDARSSCVHNLSVVQSSRDVDRHPEGPEGGRVDRGRRQRLTPRAQAPQQTRQGHRAAPEEGYPDRDRQEHRTPIGSAPPVESEGEQDHALRRHHRPRGPSLACRVP